VAIDGAVQFYGRIPALTRASDVVLDLGPGGASIAGGSGALQARAQASSRALC